jgi:hypothetical protein
LFQSNEFNAGAGVVKPKAFQVKAQNTEHSVYRTAHLQHRDICAVAAIHVEPKRDNKRAYGYAHLIAGDLDGLACSVHAKEPPKRHAHITNWPAGKDERMSVAQQLAASADLVII